MSGITWISWYLEIFGVVTWEFWSTCTELQICLSNANENISAMNGKPEHLLVKPNCFQAFRDLILQISDMYVWKWTSSGNMIRKCPFRASKNLWKGVIYYRFTMFVCYNKVSYVSAVIDVSHKHTNGVVDVTITDYLLYNIDFI